MPDRNRSTTDAMVHSPYSSGVTAKGELPVAAATARSSAPRNSPFWKSPDPNPMPPNAHGPITMPAASSPRTLGSFTRTASIPPSFAAKRMSPT